MTNEHTDILRTLVAAQVAVIEHADEDLTTSKAKSALVECLNRALKLAKKLDT